MSYHIEHEKKWRISKSGYEIKTGWSDSRKVIARYPGVVSGPEFNSNQFREWLENAEEICDLYNARFEAGHE